MKTRLMAGLAGLLFALLVLALPIVLPASSQALAADEFVFLGRGAGHGVGMSQWGAWQMAREGYPFGQILAFYYPQTRLQSVSEVAGVDPETLLKVRLSANPPNNNATSFSEVRLTPVVTQATLLLHTNGHGDKTVLLSPGVEVVLTERSGKVELKIGGSPGAETEALAEEAGVYDYVELQPAVPKEGTAQGRVKLKLTTVDGGASYTREYWGFIRVQPGENTGELWAYNFVPLEKYVRGIAEVEYNWADPRSSAYYAPEAVKAQAVAARTYALAKQGTLSDNWADQCYRGYTLEATYPGIAQAAEDTAGLVLTYQGRPISAYFSGHSGGYTNASAWGLNHLPYIVAQPDPWSLSAPPGQPGMTWTRTISGEDLSAKVNGKLKDLTGKTVNVGRLLQVSVASRDTSDETSHARTILLVGEAGTAEVRASSFRSAVGTGTLPSTLILTINGESGVGEPLALGEFYDVGPYHLYHDEIKQVVELGLMSGYGNGLFGPEKSASRWQFAKISVCLYNLLHSGDPIRLSNVEKKPFADVPVDTGVTGDPSDWVAAAKSAGLVRGVTDTVFDPYRVIRRDEMTTMLCRALGWEDEADALPPGTPGFADLPGGSAHWATATYLKQQGIVLGYPCTDDPTKTELRVEEPLKRKHVAVILCRVLSRF